MLRTLVIVCFYLNLVFAKNEYYIDDSDGYGRKFDGIGGISGGGVSSEEIKFRHQAISNFTVSLLAIMHTLYTYWPQTHTNSLGFKQFICLGFFYLTSQSIWNRDSSPTRILQTVHRQN